jgi:hypothetical protein
MRSRPERERSNDRRDRVLRKERERCHPRTDVEASGKWQTIKEESKVVQEKSNSRPVIHIRGRGRGRLAAIARAAVAARP